ncbi:MAG: OsmC family protein [Peptococcaceae bacterium]|nr:OsmC family protein [Peptococcaceae bacterium]
MPVMTFKATSRKMPEGMVVESEVRGFKILADEPAALGGTDKAMNPVEMLLCALGSCQGIVAAFFAREAGVDLKGFRVDLEGDLDPAGFMGKGAVRPGFLEIRYKMYFKTDSPRENVEKLVEILESRCPVGDSIKNGVKFSPAGFEIEK